MTEAYLRDDKFGATQQAALLRKLLWRLVPFLFLSYVISYLDRLNVGIAALTMTRDLGMSPTALGLGFGIFSVASATIPRSRDNSELRWDYDTEIVRDFIAVSGPVPGHVVAQERQHCDAEVSEGAVALVVGGVSVHQPP
jgi:hypothetical protein